MLKASAGRCVAIGVITAYCLITPALADDLSCISTTFRFVGANDKICVSAFDDPKVPGVACHISQARTGGVKGSLGLAEDPSRFSIACRQVGPISTDMAKLPDEEAVYSARTSVFLSTLRFIESWIRNEIRLSMSQSATRLLRDRLRMRSQRFP
jgi:catabolite regulation protein CreA